ncbi:MAG TPA: hypothetical protein ENH29_10070 [Bacteroidetes bacterium]|nr:hypothetical protein [Bacteroidota bacterium]
MKAATPAKPYFFIKGILMLFLASLFLFSCGQTEGGGSGGLGPTDEPYLIEAVLCADVTDEQKPVAITDNFPIADRVYIWLHWANITGTHLTEVYWYDAGGDEVHRDSFQISTKNTRFINWFFLNTTSSAKPGEWSVSVFLDKEFVRSFVFDLY